MASSNVAPTRREIHLSAIFGEIGSLANSAICVLASLELDGFNAQADGLRCMLQAVGALADLGIKQSNPGAPQVLGNGDDWLGLTNFALADEFASKR